MNHGETDIAHSLISAVKEFAIEHGRAPTLPEFSGLMKGADYKMRKAFGTYTVLIQAAGLTPYKERGTRKIDNTVFQRDLGQRLEEYRPRDLKTEEPYKRCVFIPDTHFPFHSERTLEAIYRFIEKEKPEVVVQVGDLYDRYAHSRFPRSHNIYRPEQEDELARAAAESMWLEVRKAAPGARCVQQLGNHDSRPLKQILSVYPQAEKWVERMIAESMTFEGVETILDPREELKLPGDVDVIHGYLGRLGDHRNYTLTNVVHGHTHTGGVVFRQIAGRVLWELDCGLAGDMESKALSYTPQKSTKHTLGWGFLDEYGPRFIPLRG